jgi:hypothetical protein
VCFGTIVPLVGLAPARLLANLMLTSAVQQVSIQLSKVEALAALFIMSDN